MSNRDRDSGWGIRFEESEFRSSVYALVGVIWFLPSGLWECKSTLLDRFSSIINFRGACSVGGDDGPREEEVVDDESYTSSGTGFS